MFKQAYSFLILSVCIISNATAQTYIRDYTYKASEADSKISSRTNALDQVKLILLQEIGTHIRQKLSIKKDSTGKVLANEDVEAITAGLTKVEILEEKWNGETFYLKAKIDADTEGVLNALEEFKNNNTEANIEQLSKLKDTNRKLKESREKIAQLRIQLSQAKNTNEKEIITTKYIQQVKQLIYQAAIQGDATAQLSLGMRYRFGKGVKRNPVEAARWLRKAAEQGNKSAQYFLGHMYKRGEGVEKNLEQAAAWHRKAKAAEQGDATAQHRKTAEQDDATAQHRNAAEQGDATAQYNMGIFYSKGQGVEKNLKQAVVWYRKAAEQGHLRSQIALAANYTYGSGVKKNNEEATRWYRKAAEQGNAMSQYLVGHAYFKGHGVTKDKDEAAYWFKKSCGQGFQDACDRI